MRVPMLFNGSFGAQFLGSPRVGNTSRRVLESGQLAIKRISRPADIFHRLEIGEPDAKEAANRQYVGGVLTSAELEISLVLRKTFDKFVARALHAEIQWQTRLENLFEMRMHRVCREDARFHGVDSDVIHHHFETSVNVVLEKEIVGIAEEEQIRRRGSDAEIARRAGPAIAIGPEHGDARGRGGERSSHFDRGVRGAIIHDDDPALHASAKRSGGKVLEARVDTLQRFRERLLRLEGGNDDRERIVRCCWHTRRMEKRYRAKFKVSNGRVLNSRRDELRESH